MNRRELPDVRSAPGHDGPVPPDDSADARAAARFSLGLRRADEACTDQVASGEPWLAIGFVRARAGASRALDELERVHCRELGYLLREAARLRSSLDPAARTLRWLGSRPTSVSVWRRGFEEQLRLLERDRCEMSLDLAWLLERCGAEDVADWPAALELADASLAIAPDEVGRLERVIALLARGDTRLAAQEAALELDLALAPRREAEFLAALALARERERRFAAAARLHAAALECAERVDCRLWAAAHLLYLALVLGDSAHAEHAAGVLARIATRDDFDPREFERCARELGEATALRRRGRSFGVHPTMERHYLRFTAASTPIVRRVAVALG
ncbi:MAG: hypothetical protein K8S98_02830 [Planctomycetes bacterium]|nr:hypothetical protein [Planctomycetota bacterium]